MCRVMCVMFVRPSAHQGRAGPDWFCGLSVCVSCPSVCLSDTHVCVCVCVILCVSCLSVRPPIWATPDRTGFVVCLSVCHVRPSVSLIRVCVCVCVCVSFYVCHVCPSVRPSGPDRTRLPSAAIFCFKLFSVAGTASAPPHQYHVLLQCQGRKDGAVKATVPCHWPWPATVESVRACAPPGPPQCDECQSSSFKACEQQRTSGS